MIGSAFYIMDMVEGRVFWDATLPAVAPAERRADLRSANQDARRAAQLPTPETIGLGDYGKPGNYFARQIDRWTKQYRASETKIIAEMDRLIDWLPTTLPRAGARHPSSTATTASTT